MNPLHRTFAFISFVLSLDSCTLCLSINIHIESHTHTHIHTITLGSCIVFEIVSVCFFLSNLACLGSAQLLCRTSAHVSNVLLVLCRRRGIFHCQCQIAVVSRVCKPHLILGPHQVAWICSFPIEIPMLFPPTLGGPGMTATTTTTTKSSVTNGVLCLLPMYLLAKVSCRC